VCRVEVQDGVQCWFWRAVHCGWWVCHQLVVEGEVGWENPMAGGRQSVQSISQQTDCQFAGQWASRGFEGRDRARGAGGMDGQGPGAAARAHAEFPGAQRWLMQAVRRAESRRVGTLARRAGQLVRGAWASWQLAGANWGCSQGAVSGPSVRQRASSLYPNKTSALHLGSVLARRPEVQTWRHFVLK